IIPLSAVIFHRISLAAPFANFVAIPLIGIVLPLGMLATLIGMIPGFGIYIALVLTAANWLGMRFFLIWDDFWARILPYPQVPEWGSPILILFYAGVLIFIFREKLALSLKIAYLRTRAALSQGANRVRFGVASAALLVSVATLLLGFKTVSRPELTVTMLDLSYPARGMAALIQTPDGSNILVDGGFEGKWGYQKRYVNQGQRGTADVLLAQGVISFDAVVSSSFDSSLLGGLNFILASDDYFVRKLYAYLPPESFGPQDININRFKEFLTPHFRQDADRLYETLLLGYWESPLTVMEFQNYFKEIGEQELDEFISSLDSAAQTAADNALADYTEKKKEKHEELIESILSTYQMLDRPLENREEAEEIARKWDMPLLSTDDYRALVTELPPIAVWYIYQQGGVVHSIEGLEGYLNELKEKFVEAVGDTKGVYREDEKFLQYHRLIYTVWKKKIPITSSHYGMDVIKPRDVNGMPLSIEILNPPEKRFTGTYVSDANSTVMRVRYGDYSVLFTSLINQEASEWLLTLPEDEIKSTIYQIPEFGKGGRFVNSDLMFERVEPEVAVFHYKGGRYVDKRYEEVAGLCTAKGIRTFNTPEDGAVIIHIYGDAYQVESMLGGLIEEELDVADDNAAPDREKELGVGF
nr:ComEC/Rec2 family competence protein [bacterium]